MIVTLIKNVQDVNEDVAKRQVQLLYSFLNHQFRPKKENTDFAEIFNELKEMLSLLLTSTHIPNPLLLLPRIPQSGEILQAQLNLVSCTTCLGSYKDIQPDISSPLIPAIGNYKYPRESYKTFIATHCLLLAIDNSEKEPTLFKLLSNRLDGCVPIMYFKENTKHVAYNPYAIFNYCSKHKELLE